jgi:hypothetical protein
MTQPVPEVDEESLAYELAAEATVTAGLAAAVGVVVAIIATVNAALQRGTAPIEPLRDRLASRLDAIRPQMQPALAREVDLGLRLGWAQASAMPPPPSIAHDDPGLLDAVDHVDERARAGLDRAAFAARYGPMATPGDAQVIGALAVKVVTDARGQVRWATNRAVNTGSTAYAAEAGLRRVWVAERDACLHCLAYSGQIAEPGVHFPAGLTFATKALRPPPDGLPNPPLHPNCRCRVWPYEHGGPAVLAPDVPNASIATALAREARRSVVRGWSAHASTPERFRAAERLLAQGAALPKTVQRRAARDVRKRKFTQRHVPITTLRA